METKNIVWILIILGAMFYVGYQLYLKYLKVDPKRFVPNKEYIPKNKQYECKLFYTTWCPHCKDTLKEWGSYKNTRSDIVFSLVDCDKDKEQADLYEIDSYPSILLFVNDKKYIFDANFSKEAMDKFLDTVLNLWFYGDISN